MARCFHPWIEGRVRTRGRWAEARFSYTHSTLLKVGAAVIQRGYELITFPVVMHSRRPTNKLRRRYSPHSPSSRRYSLSPERYQAGHSNGGDNRYQASQLGYVGKPGSVLDRARPSTDPLALNPPHYQVQATHGDLSAQGQSYPSYPTSQAARARPSTHPLAQGAPGYQTRATQGLPPSEGQAASQGYKAQPFSVLAIAEPLSGGRHNQFFDRTSASQGAPGGKEGCVLVFFRWRAKVLVHDP